MAVEIFQSGKKEEFIAMTPEVGLSTATDFLISFYGTGVESEMASAN